MAKKDSLLEENKENKENKKTSAKVKKGSEKKKSDKPGIFSRIKKWFHDLRIEFKKVTWPDKKTVVNHTTVVIATVVVCSVFIGLLDEGLLKLMELLIGLGK